MKSPLLSKGWRRGVSSPCTTVNTSYILIRCQCNVWSSQENLSRIPGWEWAERENKGKELSPENRVVLVMEMVLVEGSLPISSLYNLTLSPLPYSLHCLSIFTYPSGYLQCRKYHIVPQSALPLSGTAAVIFSFTTTDKPFQKKSKVIQCCLPSNKINKITHTCTHTFVVLVCYQILLQVTGSSWKSWRIRMRKGFSSQPHLKVAAKQYNNKHTHRFLGRLYLRGLLMA